LHRSDCSQKGFPVALNHLRLVTSLPQTDPQSFKLGNRGDEAAADHRAVTDAAGAATVAHRQRLMELERSGADVLGDLHHSLADLVNQGCSTLDTCGWKG
jgi:hypothetical protein